MSFKLAKQPRGFFFFCTTEMWERYGFYIVQFSLSLMLLDTYHLDDKVIFAIVSSFTGLVYLSPILDGYLADKYLGFNHAIMLGCLILMAGYGILAGGHTLNAAFLGLAIIAVGTGLIKSNISAFLGAQYPVADGGDPEADPRRHRGFSIFYAIMNTGSVISSLSCGYLQKIWPWHSIYLTATLGLLIGFLTFYFGIHARGLRDPRQLKHSWRNIIIAYLIFIPFVGLAYCILRYSSIAWFTFLVIMAGIMMLVVYKSKRCLQSEKRYLGLFYSLVSLSIVYWALFFLMFSSLTLFIKRVVNDTFLGIHIPVPVFSGIESLGIVILGPTIGFVWAWLRHHNRDLSTPAKFALGFCFMAFSMLLLYLPTQMAGQAKIASIWVMLAYVLMAVSELSLSAIGLAMVTQYVPPRLTGMMMGVWFAGTGLGGKLSELFADIASIPDSGVSLIAQKHIYAHAFLIYFLLAAGAMLVNLGLVYYLKRKA